ncbi:MAG: hypothetical protein K6A23_00280 [Butyrivibrio sp.]|nr:hypothetical protein [Butyrivibrio sp.]
MEERRKIRRVEYPTKTVLVDCINQTRYYVKTFDASPVGIGIIGDASLPDLVGKDVIIIAETMIMYAEVVRQEKQPSGEYKIGVNAKRFSDEVLEYLFDRIVGD